MNFTSTTELLPIAGKLEKTGNTYYLITIKDFGPDMAMYLENEKGEKAWYKDYASMIIRDVLFWAEIKIA